MGKLFFTLVFTFLTGLFLRLPAQINPDNFPHTEISNDMVIMKLALPDPEHGFYRATRFDWSGVIYSLIYKGHEYFGYWKTTHDPKVHEDLAGPVEASVGSGMGYEEAPVGGTFVRLGVGALEKPEEKDFQWAKTYKIVDNGKWRWRKGKDWIEFLHEIKTDNGWGYSYRKKISLRKDIPGFVISHSLENTGSKAIQTDFFNHNFFMIDHDPTGKDFVVRYPFNLSTADDLKGFVKIDGNKLEFIKDLNKGSVWMEFKGYSDEVKDHHVEVLNKKTGAGISYQSSKPIYRMVFWACHSTLCPENFIYLDIPPGGKDSWDMTYTLFVNE